MLQVRAALILSLSALVIAGGTLAVAVQAFDRGPFICDHCPLQTPRIDEVTKDFLKENMAAIDRVPMLGFTSNSRYIVRSTDRCVSYRFTWSGRFYGGQAEDITRGKVPTPPSFDPASGTNDTPRPTGRKSLSPAACAEPGTDTAPSPVGPPRGGSACVTGPGGRRTCNLYPH